MKNEDVAIHTALIAYMMAEWKYYVIADIPKENDWKLKYPSFDHTGLLADVIKRFRPALYEVIWQVSWERAIPIIQRYIHPDNTAQVFVTKYCDACGDTAAQVSYLTFRCASCGKVLASEDSEEENR
jgi:hypothetical protein